MIDPRPALRGRPGCAERDDPTVLTDDQFTVETADLWLTGRRRGHTHVRARGGHVFGRTCHADRSPDLPGRFVLTAVCLGSMPLLGCLPHSKDAQVCKQQKSETYHRLNGSETGGQAVSAGGEAR